jgi:hypothetical protein
MPANAAAAELSRKNSPRSSRNMTCPKARTARLIGSGRWSQAAGGLAPGAFGNRSGEYLAILLRETKAPLASRWGAILLRRALLSNTDTPRRCQRRGLGGRARLDAGAHG